MPAAAHSRFPRIVALMFVLALPCLGQIPQDHPELCGKPGRYIPLPPNITAVSGEVESNLFLELNGSKVTITMGGVNRVLQVCPLANGVLAVFGLFEVDPTAYDVHLVDSNTGTELHSFAARSPTISPDQHWLALREFSPVHSDIEISEQYLLYDLTKNAAGNRIPGVDYSWLPPLGRTIYPATERHIPFGSGGLPSEQVHSFHGNSFHWAADSRSLVFVDSTTSGTSLVLVRIEGEELTTYVHPVGENLCLSQYLE
jgi:hypothetical protein